MPDALTQLRREASRLFRLVDQIQDYIEQRRAFCSYIDQSSSFLTFVIKAADATRKHLSKTLTHAANGPKGAHRRQQTSMKILGEIWAKLHNFVKPVADADTLNVPIGLALLLNRAVCNLPELSGAKIAVELTSDLNYLQRRHDPLRELVKLLQVRLHGDNGLEFPTDLGIIGLPYSQGAALFFNCLLYHELGHYVVEQRNLLTLIRKEAEEKLKIAFPTHPEEKKRQLAKRLRPWLEEIFCDLFAVRMLGPAYTFIFAELFDLLGDFRNKRALYFMRTHPPGTVRLHEQLKILHESSRNWDPVLAHLLPELYVAIKALAAEHEETPEKPIPPGCEDVPAELAGAFKKALPKIRELAKSATNDRHQSPDEYLAVKKEMLGCLERGIVPSAMYQYEEDPKRLKKPEEWCVMLINAAYFLQLGDLANLFSVIEGARDRKNDVEMQARIRRRIEQWTLKSIEDVLLSLSRG